MSTSQPLHAAATRRALSGASNAPSAIDTDRGVYRREIDAYFKCEWRHVWRVELLARPGDYMALRLADEPVLLSRDKDGRLHASHNMCAHRGVEVAYGSGNTRSFKCPLPWMGRRT